MSHPLNGQIRMISSGLYRDHYPISVLSSGTCKQGKEAYAVSRMRYLKMHGLLAIFILRRRPWRFGFETRWRLLSSMATPQLNGRITTHSWYRPRFVTNECIIKYKYGAHIIKYKYVLTKGKAENAPSASGVRHSFRFGPLSAELPPCDSTPRTSRRNVIFFISKI